MSRIANPTCAAFGDKRVTGRFTHERYRPCVRNWAASHLHLNAAEIRVLPCGD